MGVESIAGAQKLLVADNIGEHIRQPKPLEPLERKRRAVRRAGRILDVLDEIKVGLLSGEIGGADLERLRRAIRDERELTDDPALEAILNDVELRAAVEMAKLEQSARAA